MSFISPRKALVLVLLIHWGGAAATFHGRLEAVRELVAYMVISVY